MLVRYGIALKTIWMKYESLAGRDRVGGGNSDSEMDLDIKKAKRNKILHTLWECLTEPIWVTRESKTNNKLIQVECQPSKKVHKSVEILLF